MDASINTPSIITSWTLSQQTHTSTFHFLLWFNGGRAGGRAGGRVPRVALCRKAGGQASHADAEAINPFPGQSTSLQSKRIHSRPSLSAKQAFALPSHQKAPAKMPGNLPSPMMQRHPQVLRLPLASFSKLVEEF